VLPAITASSSVRVEVGQVGGVGPAAGQTFEQDGGAVTIQFKGISNLVGSERSVSQLVEDTKPYPGGNKAADNSSHRQTSAWGKCQT
jgi:hypothetical protein